MEKGLPPESCILGVSRCTQAQLEDLWGIQDSYCKSWDCVTSNDGSETPGYRWWDVGNRDLLNFSFVGPVPPYSNWEKDHNFAQVKIRFKVDKAIKKRRPGSTGYHGDFRPEMT